MADPRAGIRAADVDRWTRHLLHTSQHNSMPIGLGGRLQKRLPGKGDSPLTEKSPGQSRDLT